MVSFARINPTPLTAPDRLGRTLTVTDHRGVVHQYSYDSAGRGADKVWVTGIPQNPGPQPASEGSCVPRTPLTPLGLIMVPMDYL